MRGTDDCPDELARLRRLIADAACVIREKGYCELEFDVLVDEWYRMDYADLGEWLEDDERLGMADRIDYGALTTAELHELGIEVCDDPNYVPF